MAKLTKRERIAEYNKVNKGYGITGIKRMSEDQMEWYQNDIKSLDDLYKSYSNAKADSWAWIQRTYKPSYIIGMSGNNMMYSVMLVADNGDTLHITRCNNYLVEVV